MTPTWIVMATVVTNIIFAVVLYVKRNNIAKLYSLYNLIVIEHILADVTRTSIKEFVDGIKEIELTNDQCKEISNDTKRLESLTKINIGLSDSINSLWVLLVSCLLYNLIMIATITLY